MNPIPKFWMTKIILDSMLQIQVVKSSCKILGSFPHIVGINLDFIQQPTTLRSESCVVFNSRVAS